MFLPPPDMDHLHKEMGGGGAYVVAVAEVLEGQVDGGDLLIVGPVPVFCGISKS